MGLFGIQFFHLASKPGEFIVQVTFSEKGTKMTSHLHTSKFEILSFFNKIHKNKIFHSCFSFEKCVMSD